MYVKKRGDTAEPLSSYASEPTDLIEKYLAENTKTGFIITQVVQDSAIYGRLPVANAKISLCKYIGDGFYVCKVVLTDENGKSEPVAVPTVSAELSQHPDGGVVNSTYDITVEAPDFKRVEILGIPVFDGITSIQNVVMSPVDQPVPQENPNSEANRGETGGNH
jgi:hypothetical protein